MNRPALVSVVIAGLVGSLALAWLTVWSPHHALRGDLYALAACAALVGYGSGVVGDRREANGSPMGRPRYARVGRRTNATLAAGLLVAIAVSSLLNARVGRLWSGVVGDVRTVLSAQSLYALETGHYDELRCLGSPSSCIEGFPVEGPPFLDAALASLEIRSQYERSLHLGPRERSAVIEEASTGARAFAYVAVPSRQLAGAGPYPGLCGDATGVICLTPDGSTPEVAGGACVVRPGPPPSPGMLQRLARWVGLAATPDPGSCFRLGP